VWGSRGLSKLDKKQVHLLVRIFAPAGKTQNSSFEHDEKFAKDEKSALNSAAKARTFREMPRAAALFSAAFRFFVRFDRRGLQKLSC